MSLVNMQGKLSRAEMKKIKGGDQTLEGEGCKGIIECPTLEDGASCGTIETGNCKCKHYASGSKVCI